MSKAANIAIVIIVAIAAVFFAPWILGESGMLVAEHLCVGFWYFLSNSLSAISYDAGTWGPGLGAYVLALIFAHRFFSRWAKQTQRPWNFGTSFCVMLLI